MNKKPLVLKNITKQFGPGGQFLAGKKRAQQRAAVKNLSLQLDRGEIYGLIGPNGSGKTTTIKMIMGLYAITKGDILVKAKSVKKDLPETKKALGYIPEEPFLYSKMTGREFLEASGILYGMEKKEIRQKVDELLQLYPISGILDAYMENYSRGNKQKIEIIACFLHSPEVVVIDEPIRGLDPVASEKTKKLLLDFAGRGGCVFLATHTLDFAQKVCQRFGVLDKGRLVQEATLDRLREICGKPEASLKEIYIALT